MGIIKKHKRKTVIIKGSFQLKLAIIAFFTGLIAILIIGIDIYVNIANMLNSYHLPPDFLHTFPRINNILFAVMVIYTIIIVASSFFISHTIAGPIYRFEKSCEEIQNGNLTFRIKLRKNDSFPELQEKFNLMLDSLQTKITRLDQKLAAIEMAEPSEKIKEIREQLNDSFILIPPKFRE